MPSYKRGNFLGDKTVAYLKSELLGLLRIYTPNTMYGDDMTDFNESLKSIREDFQKFDDFNFKEFWDAANKKQSNYDPHYLEPTVFLDNEE